MTFTTLLQQALTPAFRAGLKVFDVIDSTNREAAQELAAGQPLPRLVVAHAQTAGVGRQGHTFASPARTGLYWSAAIKAPTAHLSLVTPAAGVALQKAVAEALEVSAQIKWVNDLLLNDRKVAGILTTFEDSSEAAVIIGVGVNLAPDPHRVVAPGQPVGALLPAIPPMAQQAALVSTWLAALSALLAAPATIMPKFRQHAAWLGEPVMISAPGMRQAGILTDFADDGAAILATSAGLQPIHDGTLRRQ